MQRTTDDGAGPGVVGKKRGRDVVTSMSFVLGEDEDEVDETELLREARVLVVGAGGIGCEVLKNLALMQTKHMEIIDLDVIDVTNLNRQFLFTRANVGLPKSQVASNIINKRFAKTSSSAYHTCDVKSEFFDLEFVRSFDLVVNALDNVSARSHVNKLCVFARVPLVDAGSGGYFGQSQVLYSPYLNTECYDCKPTPVAVTYPVCTIRSTPTEPIHCIIWAKEHLLSLISNALTSLTEDQEVLQLRQLLMHEKTTAAKAVATYNLVFNRQVEETLAAAAEVWQHNTVHKPRPLEYIGEPNFEILPLGDLTSHQLYSYQQLTCDFITAMSSLIAESRSDGICFDKDDDVVMRLVAAAAGLRCLVYNVPVLSYFETKSMAGKIVPIVASTNAIVAGLVCQHICNILKKKTLRNRVGLATLVMRPGAFVVPTMEIARSRACGTCASRVFHVTLAKDVSTSVLEVLQEITKAYAAKFEKEEDVGWFDVSNLSVLCKDKVLYDPEYMEDKIIMHKVIPKFGILDILAIDAPAAASKVVAVVSYSNADVAKITVTYTPELYISPLCVPPSSSLSSFASPAAPAAKRARLEKNIPVRSATTSNNFVMISDDEDDEDDIMIVNSKPRELMTKNV